jgi:hypothetical protein
VSIGCSPTPGCSRTAQLTRQETELVRPRNDLGTPAHSSSPPAESRDATPGLAPTRDE